MVSFKVHFNNSCEQERAHSNVNSSKAEINGH